MSKSLAAGAHGPLTTPLPLTTRLKRGVRALGLQVDARHAERMVDYLQLLERWNRTHNLTAIRDPSSMVTHHLLDSLSAAPYVAGARLLDVGSGAGLPGIPLAIALPEVSVTLIESRKKRVQFLIQAVARLRLENIAVVCGRVEQYEPEGKFDTLVTRAFATVAGFLDKAGHLCAGGGTMLAMKGAYPKAELDDVDQDRFLVAAVDKVGIPGLNVQRHIVILKHRHGGAPAQPKVREGR